MRNSIASTIALVLAVQALADEPKYCAPVEFYKHEITNNFPKLKRVHAFKFGEATLIGLAVGESKTKEVENMAITLGQVSQSDLFCTWYFNEGNDDAEQAFRHIYVPNPKSLKQTEIPGIYLGKLAGEFGANALSILSCLEKYKYAALGCNGQRHRGPTVFGMLLAYSGCTPAHALEIVDRLWDLNGVRSETRLAAIQAGYDLGNKEPQDRQSLQDKLSDR